MRFADLSFLILGDRVRETKSEQGITRHLHSDRWAWHRYCRRVARVGDRATVTLTRRHDERADVCPTRRHIATCASQSRECVHMQVDAAHPRRRTRCLCPTGLAQLQHIVPLFARRLGTLSPIVSRIIFGRIKGSVIKPMATADTLL